MKASLMRKITTGDTGWCFALINNRLAEIYFYRTKTGKSKIWAHAYIRRDKLKTKHEQHLIDVDTKRVKLVYRNKKYHKKKDDQPSTYGL